MIGKKINQLATELAPTTTDLTIIGDPVTGVSKKITLEQLGAIFGGAVSFYTTLGDFPATGVIDIIYCAKDTKKLYLWSGSAYVEVFPSQSLLDTYQLRSEKGVSNGYASLDVNGKVPIGQLPNSIMEYKGTWNAATNTPTLANGTGDTGDVYICNAAGTVNFGAGPITFAVGDYVVYSGTIWQRSSGAVGTVTSVAVSRSGDALAITGSPITTSGTINIGFAGTGAQYIKGDGTLATFPSIISQAQNLVTEVYNNTGATLTKGTIVYINGGQGNLPTVTKALATGDSTSAQTYGVVQTDITNMNNGYVVVAGRLTDLDTQAYSNGTQLYLSATTAGTWTSTKQYAPNHLVYVGIVVRAHPTQGVVEIKIQNGYEMDELHNVAAQSPSNGDILQYVTATNLWTKAAGTTTNIAEGTNLYYTDARSRAALSFTAGSGAYNSTTGVITIPTNTNQLTNGASFITLASLSAGAGISYNNTTGVIASTITQYTDALARAAISLTTTGTSGAATYNNTTGVLNIPQYQNALTNPVTGTGTTNYLPKFTGTSTIGNSQIFDNGTNILIGKTTSTGGLVQISNGTNMYNFDYDASGPYFTTVNNANTVYKRFTLDASELYFNIAASTKMILNASGNLGLGVTPSAWSGSYRAFQFGATGVLWANATGTDWYLGNNEIYNSSNQLVFLANGRATEYYQFDGQHIWNTSTISGTAGNVITFNPAMRLGSNSGLSIGTTTAAAANGLLVAGAATFSSSVTAGGSSLFSASNTLSSDILTVKGGGASGLFGFKIEAANGEDIFYTDNYNYNVIANPVAGKFGIGTTSPLGPLEVRAANRLVSNDGILQVNTNNSVGIDLGGSLSFGGIWTSGSGTPTEWAQISGRKENATDSNYAGYLSFATRPMGGVNTERMRITSGGNVGIGTNNPTTYSLAGRHLELNDAGGGHSFYHCNTTTVKAFLATNENTLTTALYTFSNHPLLLGTNNTERMRITPGGAVQITQTIQTGAPANGTAQPWKLGNAVTGTCVPSTFGEFGTWFQGTVIQIEVNGTTYKIPAVIDNYC